MSRSLLTGAAEVYAVADRWVDECLRRDGSLFTPGRAIWERTVLDDLYLRFNESPDESSASFEEKFRKQLDGAPAATIQLAAEVMYVHLFIANDYKGQTKRTLINTILGWSPEVIQIPRDLDAVLDRGVCNTGQGYKMRRPNQLWFLIDFARAWKGGTDESRAQWIDDPWAFKTLLWSLPINSAFLQRNALLHVVHPETFESTISRESRAQIARAFSDFTEPGTDDIDAQLFQIRRRMMEEHGPAFEFWDPTFLPLWNPDYQSQPKDGPGGAPIPVPASTSAKRAWFVRGANVDGENLISTWLRDGYCSIGWYELGELPDDLSRDDLIRRFRQTWPDWTDGAVFAGVGNVQRFLTTMQVGDLVATIDGSELYIGEITTNAYWTDDGPPRRRDVRWLNPGSPLDRASLPPRVFSKLRTLLTVSDLTDVVADLESLLRGGGRQEARLADPTAELADDLHCSETWLKEIAALLRRKRQVIFYGPPGTGKTYIAQALADHFTIDGGSTKLVQFHPSYAYEDFVEGYRPQTSSSDGVGFALLPGPFRQLAEVARADPANPYVLIIDEINRANLAKVFGELYFLLEYRERSIDLQYSPGSDFTLPENLFVIGTMNTADRSIALVDAAMRRRFFFVSFFAQDPEIAGILRSWLRANGCSETAANLLDALNTRIGDADFAIGPSYLMARDIDAPGVLELIWRHSILPLLEEHFYGQEGDVAIDFGLTAIHALAASSQA